MHSTVITVNNTISYTWKLLSSQILHVLTTTEIITMRCDRGVGYLHGIIIWKYIRYQINTQYTLVWQLDLNQKEKPTSNKTCADIDIAAWFVTAKKWKQRKYPSTDDWINKIWSIYEVIAHTTENSWTIKRKEVRTPVTWVNLEHAAQWENPDSKGHMP